MADKYFNYNYGYWYKFNDTYNGIILYSSGSTWIKRDRLELYDNVYEDTIDKIDDVYFKYQKCLSGICYQYVLDLKNIYEKNPMVGNYNYVQFMYNEYDIINEFMSNFTYVDVATTNNVDLTEKLVKLDGNNLKSSHRVLLSNQDNPSENGVYSFDVYGNLAATNDLYDSGSSYRFGTHVKLDNNTNVEFFLTNSGSTFPTTNNIKTFQTGHTFILKNTFSYDLKQSGMTSDVIPKLWFIDYDIPRKLLSNDFSVLNTFTGSTPSSLIRISYDIINLQFDISTDFVEFSNTSDTPNPYYKQSISGYTQLLTDATFITNSDNGDMLEILISGTTSKILFQSEIRDKNAGGNYIELNEYVNDTFFPITGTTDTSITIINLNKISSNNWERSLKQINNHYFNHFCYFSESGGTMTVSPREPYRNKYLFDVNVNLDASNYSFGYNNLYSYYTLEEHLGSIYTGFTDMHDQSSISGFTVTQEYLEQDITYPATISTQDSPLRITPTDPNDLNNFFKYTIVEADGYQTIVLDKTQTYMIIAKPKQAGASSFTPTDISTLYDIGDISNILEDIHYNQPLTWYDPFDREMISNIYRSYSEILCINTDVINRTTGTICEMPNGEFNLRLFNIRNRHNTLINSNNGITNDNNLHLKPVEILDIGIDKITKFPVPIRERDIVIVDNVQISGHTVDIITTWGINSPNGFPVTLVNGLTNEILKIKYGWIFNAKIDKAIIGEDDYGLVWYTGIWYCGEWYDGTWYNGTWYDGIWRNGRWYSWDINKRDLLISHELVKKDENKTYSKFLNGTWINGIWYNGTFGDDITITGYTSKSFMGHTDILPKLNVATWKNGKFYKGEFKNSIWENGVFLYGDMNGGYWKNGVFYDGTFDGNWWNGNFFGGIFKYGIWENGILDNVSKNVKTKFGYNTTTNTGITTEWWDGSFRNSELYSGQITPIYNKKTQWYKGDFINSKWYGGHFHTGTFDKSSFYNGVFGTEIPILTGYTTYMKDSKFLNGLWLDGIFKNSIFENGIWLDGIFVSGDLKAKNPGYSKNVIEIKSIGTLASQSSSSGTSQL